MSVANDSVYKFQRMEIMRRNRVWQLPRSRLRCNICTLQLLLGSLGPSLPGAHELSCGATDWAYMPLSIADEV